MVSPSVDATQVARLLREHFGKPVDELSPLNAGLVGRVFRFDADRARYVIKFVSREHAGAIGKERFVAELAEGSTVQVPPVLHEGAMDEYHYAIAPRLPGRHLGTVPEGEYRKMIPKIVENIDAIGQLDISGTTGYGDFDGDGIGKSNSWAEFLLDVASETGPGTFYAKWRHLFEESFLDRDYFDEVFEEMSARLPYASSERYLVHSDYGWDNTLTDNGEITAVLDWANALFGDFLYDVAWMDFYAPQHEFKRRFREFYAAQGRSIEHFDERVLCYQCHINLDNQRWLAVSNNPATYGWHRARIMELLGRGPAAGPPPQMT